jgi:hypothetical protein
MNFKKILAWITIGLGSFTAAHAQFILNNTTLSAAVADGSVRTFNVASATGINAPSFQDNTKNTFLYIDRELMNVENVQGTLVTVTRGLGGTMATGHASGALTFVIPGYLGTFWFGLPAPAGSCNRTAVIALPVISPSQGIISDCQAGRWVNGTASQTTTSAFYRLESPTIGAVSNAAAIGTNSTVVAAELYCTEIRLPSDKLLTGLAPHIGTTGGTDKWIVALYDSGGNLLANSAVAGATVGSANTWQATAFTVPYYAVGEDQYFGCVMSNGTTATLDTVTTGKDDNILTFKSASAGTFGTLPNFTAPTAFASVSGAYLYAY